MTAERREIGAFLRSRRARISPADLGLPDGGRRRTPGLRREEVAQLAAVGVTWYTWLEQGRDINPSRQVLTAISRVLRLDADERGYLFELAGIPRDPASGGIPPVDVEVVQLLQRLDPCPAYVQDASYDLLAYNESFQRLVTDLDRLPREDRNTMWLAFTDPTWRAAMPDWESVTARMVSNIRSQRGGSGESRRRAELIERLSAASPRFTALWERHDVTQPRTGHKVYVSPELGRMTFDLLTTWLQPHHGVRLVIHLPADARTEARLSRSRPSEVGGMSDR